MKQPSKPTGLDDVTVGRITAHHTRTGIDRGWTREKYYRLCNLLACTPRELAALCGVYKRGKKGKPLSKCSIMNTWLKQDYIPPYVALTLEFILRIAEVAKELRTDLGEPLIPANILFNKVQHIPSHD